MAFVGLGAGGVDAKVEVHVRDRACVRHNMVWMEAKFAKVHVRVRDRARIDRDQRHRVHGEDGVSGTGCRKQRRESERARARPRTRQAQQGLNGGKIRRTQLRGGDRTCAAAADSPRIAVADNAGYLSFVGDVN